LRDPGAAARPASGVHHSWSTEATAEAAIVEGVSSAQPPSPPNSIRQPSERLALVRWVRDMPELQEPDWLEWKRGYDLTRNPGRATTAKHLIGFANRDPDAAGRHLVGLGCLLLGVEPGNCPAVTEHDSADLETWLRPFLGEKVVFDIHYVSLDGSRVLLLAVEPPRFGDEIHCLRKGSEDTDTAKTMREGSIFVRRVGKTEPANAADVDRLTERARKVGVGLALDVDVVGPVETLDPYLLRDEFRDQQIDRYRRRLIDSLPEPAGSLISVRPILVGENRTEEEFVAQIDRFVADARERWEAFVAIKELEHRPALLELELLNGTDDNFEDVVLEVILPLPRTRVHLSASEAEETLRPPEVPPEWGRGTIASIPVVRAAERTSLAAELVARGEAETLVRFRPLRARPHTRHTLPEVMLVLAPEMADHRIAAAWRATSSSTRGQTQGMVEIEIVLGEAASRLEDDQAA